MPLYVGFDSSTQSLTATVIRVDGARQEVVYEHVLEFDRHFPDYRTAHGVISSGDGTVVAPPLMWADALDRMAETLSRSGLPLGEIRAMSGDGQQHGSVYLSAGAERVLQTLDPAKPLHGQLEGIFSRPVSPVWLDCSTTAECQAITDAVGGEVALARLTGSRAYERFTASQIRKFARTEPHAYARTERIHLVSSFMASLLAGRHAPIEPGDGSGMNLMDLAARQWAPAAVAATAPDLAVKLPPIRDSWSIAGDLAPYWRTRYGFGPSRVVAWTGDNPSSLIGLGLIAPGQLAISLGTSDTVFGPIAEPRHDPEGAGHVFGSPAGGYMALTCFANGSLAREKVRDAHGLDWTEFSKRLGDTPAGNGGALMLPWFVPEITPFVPRPGVRRKGYDAADTERDVRAIVEAQALAMRLHSRWIAERVDAIRATGGAAVNREILQIIADVFNADVVRTTPRNTASLGAALRAFHADRVASGDPLEWKDVVAGFTEPLEETRVRPNPANVAVYAKALPAYEEFERVERA